MTTRDAIDEAFEADMAKLGKGFPSELALNAAKVKASQSDDKKGAEKPDLYAKGKGRGKDGKPAEDEENDERKSKGPNKGEKKDPEDKAKDKEQGAKKTAADESAGGTDVVVSRHFKKRLIFPGMKQTGMTNTSKGRMVPKAKEASLDEQFSRDLSQVVGVDVPEADPDFQRPNVKIAGQVEDAIDMHYIRWMHERADEDVVKLAGMKEHVRNIVRGTSEDKAVKVLKKYLAAAAGGGAVVGSGTTAAVMHAKQKKREKTAGVVENPENLDLLARVRRAAAAQTGLLIHGSSDA